MGNGKWYIEQLTAPALMHRNATKFGDHTCQLFKDDNGDVRKVTYSEVYRVVKELSCGLMSKGFKKGDRAAIMCNTSPQWMWSDYSILCIGGITVCIYPTLSEKELEFILEDSGTTVVFVEGGDILEKMKRVCRPSNKKIKVGHIVVMKDKYGDQDYRGLRRHRDLERGHCKQAQQDTPWFNRQMLYNSDSAQGRR